MNRRFSDEVKQRAVRLLEETQDDYHTQWQAILSISSKVGCTPESLRKWYKQNLVDQGKGSGRTTEEKNRIKELERENKELRRANEILRKASAFFAQAELDRPRR